MKSLYMWAACTLLCLKWQVSDYLRRFLVCKDNHSVAILLNPTTGELFFEQSILWDHCNKLQNNNELDLVITYLQMLLNKNIFSWFVNLRDHPWPRWDLHKKLWARSVGIINAKCQFHKAFGTGTSTSVMSEDLHGRANVIRKKLALKKVKG